MRNLIQRLSAVVRASSRLAALLLPMLLGACSVGLLPANNPKPLFDPEKMAQQDRRGVWASRHDKPMVSQNGVCAPAGTANFILPQDLAARRLPDRGQLTMRYSPGDRINILVPGSPEFNGDYAVNADGRIILPFAGEVDALGLTNVELGKKVEAAFVKAGVFKADKFLISVRPVQYAPINVTLSGAVFQSGRYLINVVQAQDKGDRVLQKFGDSPTGRFVATALQAGGGVRPDADLTQIIVHRGKQKYVLNWHGIFAGGAVDDMPLIEGDHVEVGLAQCFQSALVRPSQITPPGIRLFYSNLSTPALSNQGANAGKDASSVPYGTRLLQGAVSANCVGGSRASNAARYAVLISRNPKTLETEVIQRAIEDLVLQSDRDTVNPYLMPDDAIVCYDSAVTDMREIASTVQSLLLPASTYKSAGGK